MIYQMRGLVKVIEGSIVIVDVQGVGFGVAVAHPELCVVGQPIELHTVLHWNQDTGPHLFGFMTIFERQVFSLLISCSGVGPKLGLVVLHALSPSAFVTAVTLADTKALSSISGIGTKKAENIIMQLKDKVDKFAGQSDAPAQGGSAWLEQLKNVSDVLNSLNYSRAEVAQALEHIKRSSATGTAPGSSPSFDELLRKALAFLAKSR